MSLDEIGDTIDSSTHVPNLQKITFSKDLSFTLAIGRRFGPITVAYKTFGKLNKKKSNAVFVFPTLTATPQVASEESNGKAFAGWWPEIVGEGKPIDTKKFFVICADHFGGCYGTTGPSSKNPDTGRQFGMDFPPFFIKDMVNCTVAFLKQIGINRLHAIVGSSLGGLLALETIALFHDLAEKAIIIGTSDKISAEFIALNYISRQAIMLDPDWNNGNYYGKGFPAKGLSIARQIGNLSYLNRDLLEVKFGRTAVGTKLKRFVSTMDLQYQIESYLDYQGKKFSRRFDANTYIFLSKAIDNFDLEKEFGNIANAFAPAKTKITFISISSDLLFPVKDTSELHKKLVRLGKKSQHKKIKSRLGHDGLFIENEKLGKIIRKSI